MNYKLIAMDFGGTLLRDDKAITEEIKGVCEQVDYVTDNIYYIYINKKNSNLDFIRDISSIGKTMARMNIFLKDIDKVKDYYDLISTKYNNVNCFIMQDSDSYNKWLVINPKGVNKANTLKELGRMENISLDEMIFFGDGLNDLEVINEVGLGVAMGNALDEIKDKSKEITDSNNNDGIVKFLEEKLNSQKVKKI